MLSVDGKIAATEINVKTYLWCDYVFEENYPMMNLDDLKNYINQNKHLPNIPKAEVIDNNGLELGEMVRLQMEKIEELTLYIIELNEKIKLLENIVKQ
jgi:hypothetical protein